MFTCRDVKNVLYLYNPGICTPGGEVPKYVAPHAKANEKPFDVYHMKGTRDFSPASTQIPGAVFIDDDHRATSVVSNLQIEKRFNVAIKEVFDKSNYKRDEFCQEIQRSDWCRFYRQKSAEEMFYVFNDILKNAMRKCVFKKKIFIRKIMG